MTHNELCEIARRWLKGSRQCYPVYSDCASCNEIPDAIGWSSSWRWEGSHVVECKTSKSDFYRDKRKRQLRMGIFRFILCEPEIITVADIEKHMPDHGLLYVHGSRVKIVRPAYCRVKADLRSEIWFLRWAINNGKKPYRRQETTDVIGPVSTIEADAEATGPQSLFKNVKHPELFAGSAA